MLAAAAAVIVTAAGRIGALDIETSTEPAIVALNGPPDAVGFGGEDDYPRYRMLGYECSRKSSDDRWPVGRRGPYCRTVFFVDAATGALGDFYTSSRAYVVEHGVHVGMPTADAERRLHRRALSGCTDSIDVGSLTLWITRATIWPSRFGLHLIGGEVEAFHLTGGRALGVYEC